VTIPDSLILDYLADAIDMGAGQRILIGGDVARPTRDVAAGGMLGLAYLPDRFLPRPRSLVGAEATQ